MNVNELEGAELDYWTAKAIGLDAELIRESKLNEFQVISEHCSVAWEDGGNNLDAFGRAPYIMHGRVPYSPSSNWDVGGPLIEAHYIRLTCRAGVTAAECFNSDAETVAHYIAETPLIAACRCIVASKHGEEVEDASDKAKIEERE